MKYCRFVLHAQPQYGLIESVAGRECVTRLLLKSPEDIGGDIEDLPSKRTQTLPLFDIELLPPVRPSKIVCVGRNYSEHAAELGNEVPSEPLIFFKPTSALLANGGTIVRPRLSHRVDHEGELGVVIAKPCHKLKADED